MNEARVHQLFAVSVLLKGAHSLIECIGGILLAVIGTSSIHQLVSRFTQYELAEDPRDFIATHLLQFSQSFSVSTQHFYAFYLLSHGLVKLFLVVGLLRNQLWAYPASLVALLFFILYQAYRYSYTGSIGLIILTIFDMAVMALIWHEYRLVAGHSTFDR